MKLYEDEAKDLLSSTNIAVSQGVVISSISELKRLSFAYPVVAKAMVLSGSRGKRGLVVMARTEPELMETAKSWLGKIFDGEVVERIRIEPKVEIISELYVSITYFTLNRGPVLLVGAGGMEVESTRAISEYPLQFGLDVPAVSLPPIPELSESLRTKLEAKFYSYISKLWTLFESRDLFLLEINPLAVTKDLDLVALDAKIVTDDAAHARQDWQFPERNMLGRPKTEMERAAEDIDATDHQGVVGRVFLELDGTIGVLAAGGGASMVAMDALVASGLKPANYTEFSGNPPKHKVKRLTEIVLQRPGLRGAILIGGKANFTDQVETLSGFLEALIELSPRFPVVVRRDGPNMAKAKAMLEAAAQKHHLNLEVYDSSMPIISAVERLATLVGEAKS